MTLTERNQKLKHLITCMKCEVSGKVCDENCPTQYDAGNMGEIIENLEAISKILEQGSVLEKVEADIQSLRGCSCSYSDGIIDDVEDILDKYKTETTNSTTLAQERYQDLIDYFGDEKDAKIILEDRKEFKAWLERLKWHVRKADELTREMEQLQSITPTRKKGQWIESNYGSQRKWYCSKCGGIHHDTETGEWREVFDFRYAYCPNCGEEMETSEN